MSRAKAVLRRLDAVQRRPDELSPSDFETAAGSQGQESVVARLTADTPVALRDGPIKVAIPAYESFQTAGDGTSQTFNLGHSVTESPDTLDVVTWFSGTYNGEPASVDYANDTITVDGPGTVETVHTFYITEEAATVKVRKEGPGGNHKEPLKTLNAGLVHRTNQSEQPERMKLNPTGSTPLRRFVATDMELQVTVDAPYVTRFEDPDGDGATATNALLQVEVTRGDRSVDGFPALVKNAME